MAERPDQLHPSAVLELYEFGTTLGDIADVPSKVLRLHALTEFYLERMIALRVKRGDLIAKDDRFTYHHKLQIVNAFDVLPSGLIGCLRKLSALRNRCAHERRPEIGVDELVVLGKMLGSKYDKALGDVGGDPKEFAALSWVIFTELTLSIVPFEIVADELRIK